MLASPSPQDESMYIAAASYALEQAHLALGRMTSCDTLDDFSSGLSSFIAAVRAVPSWISQVGFEKAQRNKLEMTRAESDARQAFEHWFVIASASVSNHPLAVNQHFGLSVKLSPAVLVELEVDAEDEVHVVRGTANLVGTRPGDFYLDFDEDRSALELSARYLEKITALYEQAKNEMKRLGLEDA